MKLSRMGFSFLHHQTFSHKEISFITGSRWAALGVDGDIRCEDCVQGMCL